MSVYLYNTRTRNKDEFKPLNPPMVTMYCCGPTVYNYAHIGNLRTYIFEDLLVNTLKLAGYKVKHVMNVTDVGHLTSDGDEGEEDRDRAGRAARVGGRAVHDARRVEGGLERARDHVDEGGDHDDGEQPAEQQEELAARAADVLLDELCERLAVVLDARVQRAEVVHGAEEDAAHEHPQQHRQPAEHHGRDGARDGARAADGAELVREGREARGRREVLVVLEALGGGEGARVDAPALGQPAPVEHVAGHEHHGGHEHDDDSGHVSPCSKT